MTDFGGEEARIDFVGEEARNDFDGEEARTDFCGDEATTDFGGEEARTDFAGGLDGETGAFFGETRTDASGDLKRKNFKHNQYRYSYHKIPRLMGILL
jgi:hypothetical protein